MINKDTFDKFSILHGLFGYGMCRAGFKIGTTVGIAILWEVVEPMLKQSESLGSYFPNPSTDSRENKIGDIIATVIGFYIGKATY